MESTIHKRSGPKPVRYPVDECEEAYRMYITEDLPWHEVTDFLRTTRYHVMQMVKAHKQRLGDGGGQ